MSRKPTDTTIDMSLNALGMLCAGSSWIDTQEKRGAEEAVASESLPSDISGRSQWEALGFVFGEPFAEDPMFCPVKMPLGWSKQRTDHSMHNNIVDAAGNTRGSFFYKAAFYDRSANMYPPVTRYSVRERLRSGGSIHECDVLIDVLDSVTGATLYTATRKNALAVADDRQAWWKHHDELQRQARAEACEWLDATMPEWRDPGAYWPSIRESAVQR